MKKKCSFLLALLLTLTLTACSSATEESSAEPSPSQKVSSQEGNQGNAVISNLDPQGTVEPSDTPDETAEPSDTPVSPATPEPVNTPEPDQSTPAPATAAPTPELDPYTPAPATAAPVPEPPQEPPVVEPNQDTTPGTLPATKETAMSFIGKNISELYAAIGRPSGSDYASSCMGDGEDGELFYDGFTVYTYREGDTETVQDVL